MRCCNGTRRFELYIVCSNYTHHYIVFGQQRSVVDIVCMLLRADANPVVALLEAREIAERYRRVPVLLAIDRHKCRSTLVDLCIALYAADFPVLVVLEIHDTLCAISCLHEAHLGQKKQWRMLDEGHLKESVSWQIAKKVKHYLN